MEARYSNEWTNTTIIRLISEYQKRPELWDSRHELYRVYTAKHESWEEIANLFECEITDVKKKMSSVLASHRRENAKVRAGNSSNWYLYNYMKFLPTHADNGVEEYLIEQDDDEHTDTDTAPEVTHEEVVIKKEQDPPKKTLRHIKRYKSQNPRLLKSVQRKAVRVSLPSAPTNPAVHELLRTIKKSELMKKRDECDSFGEYIATSLRKHDERTQSMIKHAINNILFEQEMKKYMQGNNTDGHYRVTIVDDDENPLILSQQVDED